MATLQELVSDGKLEEFAADLDEDEFPDRFLYLKPGFEAHVVAKLGAEPIEGEQDLTPLEQVTQIFDEFVRGLPMAYDVKRKKLDPLGLHVWELKTPAVRIFGWIPKKGSFIAVDVELKRNLKPNSKYDPFIRDVVAFRNGLPLDPPKMLVGVRYDDIG